MKVTVLSRKWIKRAAFLLCLLPAERMLWKALHHGLGANPIEFITHDTGDWALIFVVLTLSITPARKLLAQPQLIRFRRMLGLFAFFYACLHFSTYIVLDKFFDFSEMLQDVSKRRFITFGFAGFALMIPLAITSTAGWIRRLGGKRWQMLHRLVYATAVAGVIHYYWLVKSDVRKPLRYGIIVALLLGYRMAVKLIDKWKRSRLPAHPRSVGTFCRFLRLYVGEGKALPLMEGLRRITLLPARCLDAAVPRMKHNGRIQAGCDAHIVVFDPEKIREQATYREPALRSQGMDYVVVNGTIVCEGGRLVDGVAPSQRLRHSCTEHAQ